MVTTYVELFEYHGCSIRAIIHVFLNIAKFKVLKVAKHCGLWPYFYTMLYNPCNVQQDLLKVSSTCIIEIP